MDIGDARDLCKDCIYFFNLLFIITFLGALFSAYTCVPQKMSDIIELLYNIANWLPKTFNILVLAYPADDIS